MNKRRTTPQREAAGRVSSFDDPVAMDRVRFGGRIDLTRAPMRPRLIALLTIVALAAGGVLAAVGFSGDGKVEPATSFETRYVKAKGARDLEPANGAPRLAGRGSGLAIRHLVTPRWFTVDGNSNLVLQIKCPRRLEPITGGALSGPDLAISNSSRLDPETNEAGERSWYIGVTNLTVQDQRFRGTIVCARGI
jgi:hypothetical protein